MNICGNRAKVAAYADRKRKIIEAEKHKAAPRKR
jgi:hypothetical protein